MVLAQTALPRYDSIISASLLESRMEFLIGLLVLAVAIGAIYAFVIGCRAINRGLKHEDEYAYTLYLLGINACEPLVNIVVIPGAFSASWQGMWAFLNVPFNIADSLLPLLVTLPMSILLTAVFGLFFRERFYRSRSQRLLALGIARWGVTIFTFVAAFWWESVGWATLSILGGTVLLWYSAIWAHGQLNRELHAPLPPATIQYPTFRDQQV
jgi:hypothetical protein